MGARIRHVVTETLLWAAAAAGLMAIALVAAAYLFNISLIMFRTGSMEPTIPAGAVSVVQEVQASSVQVGDVLTVDRPGQLPVTHRVTSVELGASPEERVITMQGDANETEDPSPYIVTEAREVLWSVPGLANAVNQMGSPYVLGGVTLGASVLVGWAFWPNKIPPRAGSPAAPPPTRPRGGDLYARRRKRSHSAALLLLIAAGSAGTIVSTPDAAAATEREDQIVRETADSDYVVLRSAYVPEHRLNMAPGDIARWDIEVSMSPPETVSARTGLSMTGEFPLNVRISACDQQWTDGPTSFASPEDSCPGTSETLLDASSVESTGVVHWMDRTSSARDLWLRVDTELPLNLAVPANSSAIVRVHAEVAGDQVSASPGGDTSSGRRGDAESTSPHRDLMERGVEPPALAQTGGSFLWLLALALALITIGRVLHKYRGPSTRAGEGV